MIVESLLDHPPGPSRAVSCLCLRVGGWWWAYRGFGPGALQAGYPSLKSSKRLAEDGHPLKSHNTLVFQSSSTFASVIRSLPYEDFTKYLPSH